MKQELEAENLELSSRLSNCTCNEVRSLNCVYMYICCVCVHVPSKCSFFFFLVVPFFAFNSFKAKHVLATAQKEKRLGDSGANVGIPAENSRESKKKLEERVPGFVFETPFLCSWIVCLLFLYLSTSVLYTGRNTGIMNHHCKRYVALKIMYFGQRYAT